VAELVRQDAGELAQVLSRHQRQADGEHQVVAEQAQRAAPERGRGVDLAGDVDAARFRGADRGAQAPDEGEEERFAPLVGGHRAGALGRTGEDRLEHEQQQDAADDQRTDIEQQHRLDRIRSPRRGEQVLPMHRVPPPHPTDRPDDAQIDQRQQDHQHSDQHEREAVAEGDAHRADVAGERRQELLFLDGESGGPCSGHDDIPPMGEPIGSPR
jgi:hypothetical protein